jgi:hypothetical protein
VMQIDSLEMSEDVRLLARRAFVSMENGTVYHLFSPSGDT